MGGNAVIYRVPCEVFTRVCGFYRPVRQFNPGKKEEYGERLNVRVISFLMEKENCGFDSN